MSRRGNCECGLYSLIQCAKLAGFDPYAFLREPFKSWETHPRT
ncbi:hypothetical protein LEP1GSC036_1047 [Leptospira weilii str. 2006001853]|uniref:Uncharacterized protein n=1 Tax=Leptospira weilii str. 2006001853 TaxID=1001589 RepID=A0A828Z099_9LEPT|nr:hypothetical protein LEP1GSC036_1047 [Leptospira weilii str. 2006001853]